MRTFTFVLTALVLASLMPLRSTAERTGKDVDLAGEYVARGVGIDGKQYGATVTLEARGETYLVRWHFDDADFTGVGIRQNDVLSVGWLNHGKAGVVLYTIHGNSLDGRWADGSTNGKVCTENLTRQ